MNGYMSIHTVHTVSALRDAITTLKVKEEKIALVPTMGALHAGHIALVKAARAVADAVVVSIFVNPTQFGPSEDYSHYPRTLEQDKALLEECGVDLVYAPEVAEMYTEGFATTVSVSGISNDLCGAHRSGHFDGVATIVTKLLLQVQPHAAFFGEKDYQQLCLIKRLSKDLNIPVDIHAVPTEREQDGLAMSSRNRYLSASERITAAKLYAILQLSKLALQKNPDEVDALIHQGVTHLHNAGFDKVEYLALRQAETLQPVSRLKCSARLLAAVWLGNTRLIDNIPIEGPHG